MNINCNFTGLWKHTTILLVLISLNSNRGKKSTICFSIFYDEVITPHHKI